MKAYDDNDSIFESVTRAKPTERQLNLIQQLCEQTDTPYEEPADLKEASELISILIEKRQEDDCFDEDYPDWAMV